MLRAKEILESAVVQTWSRQQTTVNEKSSIDEAEPCAHLPRAIYEKHSTHYMLKHSLNVDSLCLLFKCRIQPDSCSSECWKKRLISVTSSAYPIV